MVELFASTLRSVHGAVVSVHALAELAVDANLYVMYSQGLPHVIRPSPVLPSSFPKVISVADGIASGGSLAAPLALKNRWLLAGSLLSTG